MMNDHKIIRQKINKNRKIKEIIKFSSYLNDIDWFIEVFVSAECSKGSKKTS